MMKLCIKKEKGEKGSASVYIMFTRNTTINKHELTKTGSHIIGAVMQM